MTGRDPRRFADFEVTGPLPRGTTLLEASAGTGKTWTIGALVARYVIDAGVDLRDILVITFGRAASQELRERVRQQLVEAEQLLARPDEHRGRDRFGDLLIGDDPDEVPLRHARARAALADFDAATIATTHQFCHLVLESLGVAGDTDPAATLVEDLDDLTHQVVEDLYLRKYALTEAAARVTWSAALAVARAVVNDPQARIEPRAEPGDTTVGQRVAFATAVRAELERRKRRLGIIGYDDLLAHLSAALREPDAPARQRLRQRWRIVLVDEFQDTDPVQWQVLDRAFSGVADMVLIGDPKQAIYAFRGGDVVTYLQAADTAASISTLSVNWRADQALVDALQVVLGRASLGDDRIVVHPVTAHHAGSRLTGEAVAPVRLRVLTRDPGRRRDATMPMGLVRTRIAEDLAADIHRLVTGDTRFAGRPVVPGDIAVIANKHDDLAHAQRALAAVGVPAVIAGGGSVFQTPGAEDWLILLEALDQPHRSGRVNAVALTTFIGDTVESLEAGGPARSDVLAERMREWHDLFAERGIPAVFEATIAAGLAERLLATIGGERRLTDLRHLAEVLHEATLTRRLGLVGVIGWLRRQIEEARAGRGHERTRRLDSDASAVQLVTIHASKGLQFPIVYLPSLADRWVSRAPDHPRFHDGAGRRCRHVGGGGFGWDAAVARAKQENAGESLRLAYVALTRAQSQIVCWWAPGTNARHSPLHRLLLTRRPGESEVPEAGAVGTDETVWERLRAWEELGGLQLEPAVPTPVTPRRDTPDPRELSVRSFTRPVDTTWRRTSYSALTRDHTEPSVGSEPETPLLDDESAPLPVHQRGASTLTSPWADFPSGAAFGSLVHAVLEHADPAAPDHDGDLTAEFVREITEQRVWWPADVDPDQLAGALVAACETPLGPLAAGRTLRQIPRRDRLCELEFEAPLGGGDSPRPGPGARLGDLAPLLRRGLAAGDPMRQYADRLGHPLRADQPLRGYLTGSLDLVVRVDGRYLVADYKTNWLGPPPSPDDPTATLSVAGYHPDALADAMLGSDYPLQALLYATVLHRYLRWRLPDYQPERHLGGVLYLYLRGMCGPQGPTDQGRPYGVHAWHPPAALVADLSDLLERGPR